MSVQPSFLDVHDSYFKQNDIEEYLEKIDQLHKELGPHWEFEVIPDFFKQSRKETDDKTFNYLKEDFGREASWEVINSKVSELNKLSEENVVYKLMFLARHGQGYHNVAHMKYGNEAWEAKWGLMTGDGELVWGPDPQLTDLGIEQAKENHQAWEEQINQGAKLPTKWFASPFSRSLDTLVLTWNGIVDLKKVKPEIYENLRETIGKHTCDKRDVRSVIAKNYEPQGFIIEPGFEEKDVYFKDDYRETVAEQAIRMNRAFQQIMNVSSKADEIISVTSHSGSIRTQLLVIGHRPFAIGTGGMIPVVVKATKVI